MVEFDLINPKEINIYNFDIYLDAVFENFYKIYRTSNICLNKLAVTSRLSNDTVRRIIKYIEDGTTYSFKYETIKKASEFVYNVLQYSGEDNVQ